MNVIDTANIGRGGNEILWFFFFVRVTLLDKKNGMQTTLAMDFVLSYYY